MRRVKLRLRSSSGLRQGRMALDYLRELIFVVVFLMGVAAIGQVFRQPESATLDRPRFDHPVYGMAMSHHGETLWVAREHYGMSEISLPEGTEREQSRLLQSEASYASHGGDDRPLTLRYGLDRSVELLHGYHAIHREMLPEQSGYLTDSDVSADGRHAAIVTSAGVMKIWRVNASGEVHGCEWTIPEQVDHLKFSTDGKQVSLLNWESVFIWDASSGREIAQWKVNRGVDPSRQKNRAINMAWSPDRTHLALAFDDGIVRVWECVSRQLVWERKIDFFQLSALAFDSSGRMLATGGFDQHVRLWDWTADELLWERQHHSRAIHNLVFAADNSRLFSGGLDGAVYECAVANGDVLRRLP